uniref:FAD binding domain-containing protein n=1 Tax=Parasphingorhabdus sp. TaxID=2709688 RepID=UPI0035931605
LHGFNRIHAILGASENCIATYPGDMAVALSALDAEVQIEGRQGERSVPVREFHRLPGDRPDRDNVLETGDVITAVTLPAPMPGRHVYRKVRDRSSYAFALVSVAGIVDMEDGRISSASLAFGGLAHKPWHDPAVADVLIGEKPSSALFDRAADILLAGAQGYGANDFKIALVRRTLHAALAELTGDGA